VTLLLASAALVSGFVLPAQADTGATSQRATSRPGSIQVAMSDFEAFGLAITQPPGDMDYLPRVLEDYRSGDLEEADILKSKLTDPAALALAEWVAIRSRPTLRFERITAFQRDY